MCRVFLACFFVISLIFSISCFANDNVTLSVALKLNAGEHREEVFIKKRLLSLLHWPVLPTVDFNLGLDVYMKFFHFSSEFAVGFPSIAGNMKDKDYTDEKQQRITLFSQHIAYNKESFSISSSFGIPINCFNPEFAETKQLSLILEPSIGIYFSHIKWHAKEGYLQYRGEDGAIDSSDESHFWKPSWPKVSYKGDGVTYIKKTVIPFFAFSSKIVAKKKWIILLRVMFSPFLFSYSTDIHFDKKTAYLDNFVPPGFAFEAQSILEWKFVNRCSIFASLSYFLHYNKNGATNVLSILNGEEKATFPRGSAGITSNVASIRLGSKFYF